MGSSSAMASAFARRLSSTTTGEPKPAHPHTRGDNALAARPRLLARGDDTFGIHGPTFGAERSTEAPDDSTSWRVRVALVVSAFGDCTDNDRVAPYRCHARRSLAYLAA